MCMLGVTFSCLPVLFDVHYAFITLYYCRHPHSISLAYGPVLQTTINRTIIILCNSQTRPRCPLHISELSEMKGLEICCSVAHLVVNKRSVRTDRPCHRCLKGSISFCLATCSVFDGVASDYKYNRANSPIELFIMLASTMYCDTLNALSILHKRYY